MTLPPIYNNFVTAWESTPLGERTKEKLIQRLVIEETRSNIQDADESSALWAKRTFKDGKKSAESRFKGKKKALGNGVINIMACSEGNWEQRILVDVLYVPDMKMNLFSLGAVMDKDLTNTANKEECKVFQDDKVVAMGIRKGKLYQMVFRMITDEQPKDEMMQIQANIAVKDSLELWHQRMAHQNIKQVENTSKLSNINYDNDVNFFSDACVLGKMHKFPFPSSQSQIKRNRRNNPH